MIEKQDYTKYLSYDSGHGFLISSYDKEVMNQYGIDYQACSSLKMLIFQVEEYLDGCYAEDIEDLEEVLLHLNEMYYYYEVKK